MYYAGTSMTRALHALTTRSYLQPSSRRSRHTAIVRPRRRRRRRRRHRSGSSARASTALCLGRSRHGGHRHSRHRRRCKRMCGRCRCRAARRRTGSSALRHSERGPPLTTTLKGCRPGLVNVCEETQDEAVCTQRHRTECKQPDYITCWLDSILFQHLSQTYINALALTRTLKHTTYLVIYHTRRLVHALVQSHHLVHTA
jgi:hypothetical protein